MSSPASNADIDACLSIVMPVYNESATIAEVVARVLAQRPVKELIIVDDASRDGTWDELQRCAAPDPRVRLLQHTVNQGKGAALRTGFAHATSDYVLVQDADLEYDPEEYHILLKPILSGHADVVYGSRFGGSMSHRVLYFWHSVGNRMLTLLSNITTNLNISDMETCYKLFKREVLQKFKIEENRFGFEPEITAKISRLNLRIYEVSISYFGRTYAEGKKIGWRDALSAIRCIVKYGLLN